MSVKPDFATMTVSELRAYVLAHRGEEEALHAYLDKLHTENPNSRIYHPEDDIAEAISDYLKSKTRQEAYHNLDEILAIFGSDLSEKEILEELKKYSAEDVEAAKRIMLSGVTAVKDFPSEETSF